MMNILEPRRSHLDSVRCWRAVKNRRSSADGTFVYAVRSTKVYCRPSCPSRRPGRQRVVFFAVPADAERAGFRPCRRCRPQCASPNLESARLVHEVCRRIDTALAAGEETRLTLSELSQPFEISTHKLERLFRNAMGITPRQFTDAQRMKQLKSSLQKGEKVTLATYDAGFGSSSRLYERAPAHLGMTPAAYRRGGVGMRISYTVVPCPLGRVLVAATERGISAVCLGGSRVPLERALVREYPRAEIRRGSNDLSKWVRDVLQRIRGHEPHEALPLDVQATAFQRRVWEELRRIPPGVTRTYSQIAHSIGNPRAVRAVARACATNPVSIVVPCHRVVRGDGKMAGYRWGLKRKRALLTAEAAAKSVQPTSPTNAKRSLNA